MTVITSNATHPSKEQVLAVMRQSAIIPVVRVNDSEEAICAAEGMVRARYPLLELTLTVPNAFRIIEEMTRRFGNELIVGAGTVLNAEDCNAAILAGAQFIVSPSTNARVIEIARSQGLVSMPGALSPTEVLTAWQAGADLIKIFPADAVGGPRYIRALKGPFPEIQLVPSSGVDMSNIAEYFLSGAYAVAIGGLIFDRQVLREGRTEIVAANIQRFAAATRAGNGE